VPERWSVAERTTCRASAGVCDMTDACNGSSKVCRQTRRARPSAAARPGLRRRGELRRRRRQLPGGRLRVRRDRTATDSNFCNGTQTCTAGSAAAAAAVRHGPELRRVDRLVLRRRLPGQPGGLRVRRRRTSC
jgi:hypothetical protein